MPSVVRNIALAAVFSAAVSVAGPPAAAEPTTLYLNHTGGAFTPGEPNDSVADISSVPGSPVDIGPWEIEDATWQDVVTCVEDVLAPFDIAVVDEDPGAASHIEAVLGGDPVELGLAPTTGGVSPFRSDCGVIDDSIVFIFPLALEEDVRRVCEATAQEVAHSFGLDHEFLCDDPMSYLSGCGDKKFRFRDASCGEFEPRPCKCSDTQNSARMLFDRVGAGVQTMVTGGPSDGEEVGPGFIVSAAVTHPPATLILSVDGAEEDQAWTQSDSAEYEELMVTAPEGLDPGTHEVSLTARWLDGEETQMLSVEVGQGPPGDIVGIGCTAGGGGRISSGVLVLLALWAARRRRRG